MVDQEHSLIGWCLEHESMAEIWDDISVSCHYLVVIERHTDNTCQVVPIPPERLYRAAHIGSSGCPDVQ